MVWWQEIQQTWERWLGKTEQKLVYLEQVLLFKTSVYMMPSTAGSWFTSSAYGQWSSTNKYIKSKRWKSTCSSGRGWDTERTESWANEKIPARILWVGLCWFKSQRNEIVNIWVFTGILWTTHRPKQLLKQLEFFGQGVSSSAFCLAITHRPCPFSVLTTGA